MLAVGSAGLVGSGAFSSVDANRAFTVDIADDSEAYLRLDPDDPEYDNSAYAEDINGSIGIDITQSNNKFDGNGVSPFAETVIEDVFPIENQGTQEVQIAVLSDELTPSSDFELFATPAPGSDKEFDRTNLLKETGNLPVIEPGESVAAGMKISATTDGGSELSDLQELLTNLDILIQASAEEVSD
jgi:hypothetical protein